jgi:2-hydroxychromene-2-carboxylate isomerase
MRSLDFYFDVISPYAYLAFHDLPRALEGHEVAVRYRPLVFGAVLGALGQLGPAEIPGKREWTYRQVLWLARERGLPMQMPTTHPFNSLALQRLAIACDPQGLPDRTQVQRLFEHVWCAGQEATDADRLAQLTQALQPARDPQSSEVKQALRACTDAAVQAGVFGTPTMVIDGRVFWGNDALPMLQAYLGGDPWFHGPDWVQAGDVPQGVRRPQASRA